MSVSSGEFNIDSANVKGMFSVSDAGGDGSLAYNSSNGTFTYTGPSASEVRAHLTANKGLSVSSGEFNIDSSNVKGMFSGGTGVTYNSGTGAISIGQAVGTGDNVSFQDVTVSSRLNVTDSSSFGGNLKGGGNLIVSGSSTVVNTENILKVIRNKKPGDIVDIQVFREGKTLELITKLGFGEARIIDPQNQN